MDRGACPCGAELERRPHDRPEAELDCCARPREVKLERRPRERPAAEARHDGQLSNWIYNISTLDESIKYN